MTFNIKAFALAFGLWWGAGVFFVTWWRIFTDTISGDPMMLELFYPWYSVTPLGSVIGFVWGFVCGAICGGVLAWLYNFLSARMTDTPQT